jgi:hypothetical protein
MEEFDIDIFHCLRRRHGNVDGLTKAYEGVGDVLKDNDFQDAAIMTINAEEMPKEYREIIQYLDDMRFLIGATKAVRSMNCAQESKLLDDRQSTLLLKKRWCFVTNHWKE